MVQVFQTHTMKDTAIKLLAALHDGSLRIQKHSFSIIGASLDFQLLLEDEEEAIWRWSTTVERYEIIAVMQRHGIIGYHDPRTRMVYVADEENKAMAKSLHYAYQEDIKDVDAFHHALLEHHLGHALIILNYEGDPEDLWTYFKDYSLIEKQALLWMLAQKDIITDYNVRTCCNEIWNYLDGSSSGFRHTTPFEVKLFAKWLKDVGGSLYGLAPKGRQQATGYTVSIA